MPKLLRILALFWIALMLGVNYRSFSSDTYQAMGNVPLPDGTYMATYDEWEVYTFGWPFKITDKQTVEEFAESINGELLLDVFLNLGIWFWAPGTLWFFARYLSKRARAASGFCPQCGYNCTGIESTECPECGYELPPEMDTAVKKPTS